jgi:hypothetical protein
MLVQSNRPDRCCGKEGLGGVSHPDNQGSLTRPVRHIQDNYRATRVPIEAPEWRFYATYFLVQTLFDKIFVGEEEIVSRDPTKFSAWHEPFKPLEHYAVSRAWCAFRHLTPPNG